MTTEITEAELKRMEQNPRRWPDVKRLTEALRACYQQATNKNELVKEARRIANDLELEVSHMDTCYSTALEAVGILRVLAAAPEPPG
ncbi:hypothetical protein LCGC14_2780050 [marine sediment metagenome]|uniref:Uncharacterized protein n=1 Tax=marine sediment metagenome TaxID=412755 RepID=A0A0F8ZFM3_9ZZZZ